MKKIILLFSSILIIHSIYSQTYPNNEDSQYQDMLTPAYYNASNGDSFRNEINKFVHFARLTPFQHPLEDALGQIPGFSVTRAFGLNIGAEHHPAKDMRVGGDTLVTMYASFDGYVATYKDAPKYRDYLTITKDIVDDLGNTIGKMVAIYGHIDLTLDEADNVSLDGKHVSKGDLVSKHLYSQTAGSPHIHFEIRYYRSTDTGTETFYGGSNGGSNLTEPSSGNWSSGYWDPSKGYGFADPENHLNYSSLGIIETHFENSINYYPNPVKDILTVNFIETSNEISYAIYNLSGQLIEHKEIADNNLLSINFSGFSAGIYMIQLTEKVNGKKSLIKVLKE